MSGTVKSEFEGLYARVEDIKGSAIRGELGISAFLSPRELHYAQSFLKGANVAFFSFGGYSDAQRKRIYVLPEYMEDTDVDGLDSFGFSTQIAALRVEGSGFEKLSHRMMMGSLLGLGIERSVIGDIVMLDEISAIVLCDSAMADFLILHLERVGRDKVKVFHTELDKDFSVEREVETLSDTVASPRLDCVVSSICKISREKARDAVLGRLVELDYECVERPDKEVKAPCVISVRGWGKCSIISLSDRTKKGTNLTHKNFYKRFIW